MMTDNHWFEILKIVLDKGLLGIFGLKGAQVLGRAMERYKSAQAFAQTVAEKKIEAFSEVQRMIVENGLRMNTVVMAVRGGALSQGGSEKEQLEIAMAERGEIHRELAALGTRAFILGSEEWRVGYLDYQKKESKLFGAIESFNAEGIDALNSAYDEFHKSLVVLQHRTAADLLENPFEDDEGWMTKAWKKLKALAERINSSMG
jgi:hypothetical protein